MYQTNLNRRSLRSVLLLGAASAAAIGLSAPAYAQDQTVETVVVTGSRIPQQGLYSSSPITVVGSQEIQLEGAVNSSTLLNQLPQNIGGETSGFDISSDGTTTVSLRGLGPQRTLVLIDGKRYVPDGIGGQVDLDAIPADMIDHVEVVTGGASAVYGSDALAGVVNVILKKNFDGMEVSGQWSGYPDYHMDGETGNLNGIMGFSTADGKGNVTMYGGYTNRDSIGQGDRPYGVLDLLTNNVGGFNVSGSGGIPAGAVYIATGPNAFGDTGGCPGVRYEFTAAGTLACDASDTYNFNPQQLNQTAQTRYDFGSEGHYEVSKQLDFYARVTFSDTVTKERIAPTPSSYFTFGVNQNNPFLSTQEFNQIFGPAPAPGTVGEIYLDKRMVDFGDRRTEFDFQSYQMVFGAKGDLDNHWSYDISAQYGRTNSVQWNTGFVSYAALQNSIDVISNGAGGYECENPTAVAQGCVPYNVYNLNPAAPGQYNAAIQAYDGVNYVLQTNADEAVITGALTGDLGEFGAQSPWAKNPVAVSIGSEYRQEQGYVRPDYILQSGNALGLSGATLPTSGGYNVTEGFTELKIPIVEGMPFFYDLEFDGGYRYSSYSLAGSTSTYKYGGDWAPTEDFKIRGLVQRAVRAPNIAELYTPNTISLNSGSDPCNASNSPTGNVEALCVATGARPIASQPPGYESCNAGQCNVKTGGNVALKPEVADTKTIGLVFTPSFFDGFTATVDYYDIDITGAVGPLDGSPQGVFNACYAPAGGITNVAAQAASVACAVDIHRSGAGNFSSTGFILQTNSNTGLLRPKGLDVQANYTTDLSNFGAPKEAGSLGFDFNGTYQIKYDQLGGPGQPLGDCAGYYGNFCGVPDPKYRWNFRVNWTLGDFLASLRWRYIGSVKLDSNNCVGDPQPCTPNDPATGSTNDLTDAQIPSVSYFDVTGVWTVSTGVTLSAGLQNMFNKKPPIVSSNLDANANNSNTFPGVYDIQGRMLFVSGSYKF